MSKSRRDPHRVLVIPPNATLLLFAALAFFFAVFFTIGLVRLNRANESLKWPSVKGKVVSSHWTRDHGVGGIGTKLTVRYTYNVGGQSFKNTFRFHNSPTPERKLRKKYSTQSAVDVFYAPDNPATSVLQQGILSGHYSVPACSFVLMIVSVGVCILLLIDGRTRRRNRASDDG